MAKVRRSSPNSRWAAYRSCDTSSRSQQSDKMSDCCDTAPVTTRVIGRTSNAENGRQHPSDSSNDPSDSSNVQYSIDHAHAAQTQPLDLSGRPAAWHVDCSLLRLRSKPRCWEVVAWSTITRFESRTGAGTTEPSDPVEREEHMSRFLGSGFLLLDGAATIVSILNYSGTVAFLVVSLLSSAAVTLTSSTIRSVLWPTYFWDDRSD